MIEIDNSVPIPIEFAEIKRKYLHHLNTGEPPTLLDLVETTSPLLHRHLFELAAGIFSKTGKVGALPPCDEAGIDIRLILRAVMEGRLDPARLSDESLSLVHRLKIIKGGIED